jgi:hypothetical protein
MVKRVLIGAALTGLVVMAVTSMPDIRRYQKIRSM